MRVTAIDLINCRDFNGTVDDAKSIANELNNKPAPATPAATPLAALNQRALVEAEIARRFASSTVEGLVKRNIVGRYLADEADARDAIADAIKNAIHEAALQPAAAQPQRESEQLEQVAKLTDKILTELFKQYSGKEFKSFRHALRRTLEPIMRAALSPQTDSQEPR